MKIALLLPGYLDSPNYLHLVTFEKRLKELGYTVERLDPCNLWKTGNVGVYSVTNYIEQIRERIEFFKTQNPEEAILIGHSLGGFISILAGDIISEVTRVVALCAPSSIENLGKKWENKPSRVSKRDLPEDESRFREFNIPLSFVEDARKYSAIDAVSKINKPLMIFIGLADTSVSPKETEILASNAVHPYVVKMQNIGHNFRHSQEECYLVMNEIEKFLGQ